MPQTGIGIRDSMHKSSLPETSTGASCRQVLGRLRRPTLAEEGPSEAVRILEASGNIDCQCQTMVGEYVLGVRTLRHTMFTVSSCFQEGALAYTVPQPSSASSCSVGASGAWRLACRRSTLHRRTAAFVTWPSCGRCLRHEGRRAQMVLSHEAWRTDPLSA